MDINYKKKIAKFFESFLPSKVPVIWMDSDGPRPNGKYITLKITPIQGNDNDEYVFQPDGTIKQIIKMKLNLSIQFYRKGAVETALFVKNKLRQKSYLDQFYVFMCNDSNISNIGTVNNVVDLTALNQTNFEERASLEVSLNYCEYIIDNGFNESGLATQFPVIIKGNIEKINGEKITEIITTIE